MKRFICISIILLLTIKVYSQDKFTTFSEESVAYIVELEKYFQKEVSTNDKKDGQAFIEQFKVDWNSSFFSDKNKSYIYKTSNLMLKKKYKPMPHFVNYLNAVKSMVASNSSEKNIEAWHKNLEKLIAKSNTLPFSNFVTQTDRFFSSNIIYFSNSMYWKVENATYTINYDSIPSITFKQADLKCNSFDDSTIIYKTQGTYFILDNKWVGKGGKVTWERAEYDANEIFAELNNYQILTKYSKFDADSVKFTHKQYFKTPVLGKISEKLMANSRGELATYPKFDSYSKRLDVKNILGNIDFSGGFSMHGARFLGTGTDEENANLYLNRNGVKFITAGSKAYQIKKDEISSASSSIKLVFGNDSIVHAGLEFRYKKSTNELFLYRNENTIAKSPFYDSFHQTDMYVENIVWKMSEPNIEFRSIVMPGTESNALFESSNYYSRYVYDKMQGMNEQNPLAIVKITCDKFKTNTITAAQLSTVLRLSEENAKILLLNLSFKGFVDYYKDKQVFVVKDKLFKYVLARAGKTDYDVIVLYSTITNKSNATLNLVNFDMKMRGVKEVHLSDSQMVRIYPYDNEIILQKNRNIQFRGHIQSGRFDFYGQDFNFEYDKFKINLLKTDSMTLKVQRREKDENGQYSLIKVKTVLEGINGELFIDDPNNKSGLKSFSQYPIFKSNNESYVYYDREFTKNGVYKRDKIYYKVKPFVIDSLDNVSTEGIAFNGEFESSGIFPTIQQPLKVQPDYSLGFVHKTPSTGYPIYKGKGQYFNQIQISNQGIEGDGTLKYLNSTLVSKKFWFYPDSSSAVLEKFDNKEQCSNPQYPMVSSEGSYMHWQPWKDVMYVHKKTTPLKLYKEELKLHGFITLRPTGMWGNGKMEYEDAEFLSKKYTFKCRMIDADTADVKMFQQGTDNLAMTTNGYKTHIDLDKKFGEFKSNGGVSKINFPINMYIAFMDELDWNIKTKQIELRNTKKKSNANLELVDLKKLIDIDFTGSEFISTHPKQDSLRFYSAKASYNLEKNIIYAKGARIIKVADAALFPDSGNVTIYKKAEIKTLENCKIIANVQNKLHLIYNSKADISSRKQYNAKGTYDYIDEDNKKFPIYLNKIAVTNEYKTFGLGKIPSSYNFKLNQAFDYIGNVKLNADTQYLLFNGSFRINHLCENHNKAWVKFNSYINPKEIYIPISAQPEDSTGANIANAFLMNKDSIYTAFLNKKRAFADAPMISSSGYMYYDKVSKEYRISSLEKLKDKVLPDAYTMLNTRSCYTYGEGVIDLSANLGRVNLLSYGNIFNYAATDSVRINTVFFIDFFFNDDCMKAIKEGIMANADLTGINYNSDVYVKMLKQFVGEEQAQKLLEQVELEGEFKSIPKQLLHTISFADVKFKWNPSTKSFMSQGPLGIQSIDKTQFSKYITGYIEIGKRKSADFINIYLEPSLNEWYFFNYERNVMQAISSFEKFNKTITELKDKDKELEEKEGLAKYKFTLSTEKKKTDFVRKAVLNQ